MVTLTVAEAQAALSALRELSEERISVTTALKVKHLLRDVGQQINDANEVKQERLEAFLSAHGLALDEKGNVRLETVALQNEWNATFLEVMGATCEYGRSFAIDELPDPLPGIIIVGLGPLLMEEEPA